MQTLAAFELRLDLSIWPLELQLVLEHFDRGDLLRWSVRTALIVHAVVRRAPRAAWQLRKSLRKAARAF
jgi:hypothetical protein